MWDVVAGDDGISVELHRRRIGEAYMEGRKGGGWREYINYV